MRTSEQIDALATALAQAQAEFTAIPKTDTNPFFKSKYAGLPQVIEVASPILTKHGLSVAQFIGKDGDEDTLTTWLLHKSGQFIADTMRLYLAKREPQAQGSATSYARRYAYMAALGLVADEDDDGNRASRPAQQHRGVQARMTATLPEAKVKELVEAIRSNGCPNEILRQQLIAVGVQSVPEKVSPSSLSMLTPQQAEKVLAWLSPEPDA